MTDVKVLVVEDDEQIKDSIDADLFSLGYNYDWVTNQQEARSFLENNNYDCVLLDLQIPTRQNRFAKTEYGKNLLSDILQIKGKNKVPVVIMTAYHTECVDLSAELYSLGATTSISKPFPSKGRTLAHVIQEVVTNHKKQHTPIVNRSKNSTKPQKEFNNEPITLDTFMYKFCETMSKKLRGYKRKSLLGAARNGTITMPILAQEYKRGRSNFFYTYDLLDAWQGFLDEGIDLPDLKAEFKAATNSMC